MNFSSKTVALYMGLIFVSGAVVGALGDRLYTTQQTVASTDSEPDKDAKAKSSRRPSPEEFRRGYLGFMKQRLDLSDDQVADLEAILDDTQDRMDQVMRGTFPEQVSIREEQNVKIRGLLSDTQLTEYDEMLKEREDRNRSKVNKRGDDSTK